MQYFKHQSNMRHDIKIRRLIAKFGIEGYGLYNLVLESITESLSTKSPLPDLQETSEDIAEFYNGNTAKIDEIMKYMVVQGLFCFDENSGYIICSKVYNFLDTSQTRSKELRDMIRAYKETKVFLSQPVSDSATTGQDKSEEENRTEQNIKETEKGETDNPTSSIMDTVIKLSKDKNVNSGEL